MNLLLFNFPEWYKEIGALGEPLTGISDRFAFERIGPILSDLYDSDTENEVKWQGLSHNSFLYLSRSLRDGTRGTLFVFFIFLIIRSALLRGMESSELLKKYSLERMILELENLSELERTKRQKDILEALEGISWW